MLPADGAEIIDTTRAVVLEWEQVDLATTHEVQLFYTADTNTEPIALKTKVLSDVSQELLVTDLLDLIGQTASDGDSTFYWRVRGRNGLGEGAWSAPWEFTLVPLNEGPTWLNLPVDGTTINEMELFTGQAEADDAEGDPITFSVAFDDPEALGFTIVPTSDSTFTYSWTPIESQAGPASYDITFFASDGTTTIDSTITINVAEVNLAPVLDEIVVLDTIVVNQLHTFAVTATDPDTLGPAPFTFNNLSFSLDAASLALNMGVTPGANNGEADFNWTPTETGLFDVTMRVDDDGIAPLSDDQLFQFLVVPAECPRLNEIGDMDMVTVDEGEVVGLTFTVSNECPLGHIHIRDR